MPELPEVETICRELDQVLRGMSVSGVVILRDKSFQGDSLQLIGKEVLAIERKAKMIIFRFKDWDTLLMIHLKMTGQLVWRGMGQSIMGGHPTSDWVNELPSRHTRVIIDFYNGGRLFFNDMRVFGWCRLVSLRGYEQINLSLPPDVNEKRFSYHYFQKIIKASSRPIKLVILDQQKMGGVGNIYANDALYDAGIDPRRKSSGIDDTESLRLYQSVIKVIAKGIKYGGATASDEKFVNVSGKGGQYQKFFLVYDREGKPCKKCGSSIIKIRLSGRGTYLCPKCQR